MLERVNFLQINEKIGSNIQGVIYVGKEEVYEEEEEEEEEVHEEGSFFLVMLLIKNNYNIVLFRKIENFNLFPDIEYYKDELLNDFFFGKNCDLKNVINAAMKLQNIRKKHTEILKNVFDQNEKISYQISFLKIGKKFM